MTARFLIKFFFLLLLTCSLFGFSDSFAANYEVVLDKYFVRVTEAPTEVVVPFASYQGPGIIELYNGGVEDSEYERVVNSRIIFNSSEIFTEFNPKTIVSEETIELSADTNMLAVLLKGKPGSAVRLVVKQNLDFLDRDGDAFTPIEGDCDDTDGSINPNATEICDGLDNNCNFQIDEGLTTVDADGDGYTALGSCTGSSDDCNDFVAAINPGAVEIWYDGTDQDCDNGNDFDRDGDGYLASFAYADGFDSYYLADCDDRNSLVYPEAPEIEDGIDNDCDGLIDDNLSRWFADVDGDGFIPEFGGYSSAGQLVIPNGYIYDGRSALLGEVKPVGHVSWADVKSFESFEFGLFDCDDTDPSVHPGADEIFYDSKDQDCTDFELVSFEYDQDRDGQDSVDYGGTDCDDVDPHIFDGMMELCNGVDDNCNGQIDESCVLPHCGKISVDETWSASTPHFVSCDVVVEGPSAPTLNIEDGAIVKFAHNVSLKVAESAPGVLFVNGYSSGVLFEPLNQHTTNFDIALKHQSYGGELLIGPHDLGSALIGLSIAQGGMNGEGAIKLVGSSPIVIGGSLVASASEGLRATNGSHPSLEGLTITGNQKNGVVLDNTSSLVTFSSNIVDNNGGSAIALPAIAVGELDTTSSITDNFRQEILIWGGVIDSASNWENMGVPYRVSSPVRVEGAGTAHLTVSPGVEIRFEPESSLRIGENAPGSLAVQDGAHRVLFTSNQISPKPGDWEGILLGENCYDTLVQISNAIVEYAGAAETGNITFNGCNGSVTNSLIQHSSSYGIFSDNANPVLSGVNYLNNNFGDFYLSLQ